MSDASNDPNRNAQERLETLLLEGISSPKSAMTKHDWSDIRSEVARRVAEARRDGGWSAGSEG